VNRELFLKTEKGRAAGLIIIIILALLASPASVVLGARTSAPAVETAHLNGTPQIPAWEQTFDPDYAESNNKPVSYSETAGEVVYDWYSECKTCLSENTNWNKLLTYDYEPKWPVSPTVKIETEWPSGQTTDCSGILVDQTTVLTAAHCILMHSTELCDGESACWPLNLQITAYQDSSELDSGFTELFTWTAWTENRDFDYDLAGIKLDTPLGSQVGWVGIGYNVDNQYLSNKTFEYTGYVESGMMSWDGEFKEITEQIFYSDGASDLGLAGAGAHCNEYNNIVYSVLSHRVVEGDTKTGHTRITKAKFSALRSWMEGDIKDLNFFNYLPYFAE
jgi:hypothetical protein